MKKLSVSLIAVVAVLFAVASAFTTQKANVSDPLEAGWHLVLGDDPYFYVTNTALSMDQASYETAVATTDDQEIRVACPDEDDELVCAAKFSGSSSTPQSFAFRIE